MKKVFAILVVLVLVGCGTKQIVPLPKVQDQNQAAKIYVLRVPRYWRDLEAFEIHLDGVFIFQIRPSKYTTMLVNPGEHVIALKKDMAAEQAIKLNCRPGENIYFIISPKGMKQTTAEVIDHYIEKKYEYLPLEYED
jgi:hypothetical protein